MKVVRLLLLAAALVGCGPPPSAVCAHGEEVYGDPHNVCLTADKVVRLAPCELHDYASSIRVIGHPFDCDRLVHGCQVGTDLLVDTVAVLPDEYGHLVWEQCFGRSGENTVQGHTIYDDDFSSWLTTVRDAP